MMDDYQLGGGGGGFFFFNDTATTEIYTLSLHDALPISFGAASQTFGSSSQPPAFNFGASANQNSNSNTGK